MQHFLLRLPLDAELKHVDEWRQGCQSKPVADDLVHARGKLLSIQ